MKTTALIVDDEPLARERIRTLLSEWPQVEVVGEAGNGYEAIEILGRHPVDLLFLDIQMPEIDGFAVLDAIGAEEAPLVIFVTAYDEHALHAFEVHALDYILKPVRPERFAEAMRRALETLGGRERDNLQERLEALLLERSLGARPLERILVRSASGGAVFVRCDQIDWIESARNYVILHLGEKSHILRMPLHLLERRLDPERFVRLHRSTLANLESIKELHRWFRGEFVAVLKNGKKLPVSRHSRQRLQQVFGAPSE